MLRLLFDHLLREKVVNTCCFTESSSRYPKLDFHSNLESKEIFSKVPTRRKVSVKKKKKSLNILQFPFKCYWLDFSFFNICIIFTLFNDILVVCVSKITF